jgi:hypothetical protein
MTLAAHEDSIEIVHDLRVNKQDVNAKDVRHISGKMFSIIYRA